MLSDLPVAATIAVRDIDAARWFYGELLGMKVAMDFGPDAMAFSAGQGTTIMIYTRPNHQPSAATVASFRAIDLPATINELMKRGVQFEDYDLPGVKTGPDHIARMGGENGGQVAWFKDPDGNILAIGEM